MVDIVTLPTCPPPNSSTLSLVSAAADLKGPQNSPSQRIARLGSRMRAELGWAPMAYDDARQFIARLLRSDSAPVAVIVPQRGLSPVSPGALVVSGSVVAGGLLPVSGGTPDFLLKEGQFFALSSGGRRWLHNVQEDTVLDANGAATLPINPLLRCQPAAGDTTEWVSPMIEGFPDTGTVKWTLEMLVRVGLQLAVTEDR